MTWDAEPRIARGQHVEPELAESVERYIRAEFKTGGHPIAAYHATGAINHPDAARLTMAILAHLEDRIVALEEGE